MMLKKIILLSMAPNLCIMASKYEPSMSKRTQVIIVGAVVVGGIAAAPFILPATTLAAIQATAITVGTNIAAASAATSATVGTAVTSVAGTAVGGMAGSVAGGVISVPGAMSFGIAGAKIVRPYVFETEQEELGVLKAREAADLTQSKINFYNCLMKNKHDNKKGSFGCSLHCQDTAYKFGLLAGLDEVEQVVKSL